MNKKLFLIFLINFQICLVFCNIGQLSFMSRLKRKKITNFQQALAQLYVQKPHLLQPQKPIEPQENIDPSSLKCILARSIDIVPLLYFCYRSYENYTNHRNTQQQFQETYLHQIVLSNFPGLLVNTPGHIGFFLQETELMLQAYLFKLFLKMLIFCFG